jgi:hypothetical protein
MIDQLQLLVIKNGKAFDMSRLCGRVIWSGRKGAPARRLQVTFLDDDGARRERTEIDVEQGHQCICLYRGQEIFRGMFMRQGQSRRKTMPVKAYDNGIYLANNTDTFDYANATASDIFRDCCARFGLTIGQVDNTQYRIPELPKPNTTAWDVIADALCLTYEATGVRYYVHSEAGHLSLRERRRNIHQLVIETGINLVDYSSTKSIEDVRTRLKLISREGAVLAEARNAELEDRIGVFQDVRRVNDEMNAAQLNTLVGTMLAENNKVTQSLPLSVLGQTEIISGVGVFAIVKPLGISRAFYVEDDSHTFEGRKHTMDLKVIPAVDIPGG